MNNLSLDKELRKQTGETSPVNPGVVHHGGNGNGNAPLPANDKIEYEDMQFVNNETNYAPESKESNESTPAACQNLFCQLRGSVE